jgi:hypothetical protein
MGLVADPRDAAHYSGYIAAATMGGAAVTSRCSSWSRG